ncbi:ORF2, partial [Penaeus monodon metallodensovirus]|uniref:ORF2 n=1 Tax=Penaeus monodon metallodensovirus TaxID=2672571 RepID=UPI002481FA81
CNENIDDCSSCSREGTIRSLFLSECTLLQEEIEDVSVDSTPSTSAAGVSPTIDVSSVLSPPLMSQPVAMDGLPVECATISDSLLTENIQVSNGSPGVPSDLPEISESLDSEKGECPTLRLEESNSELNSLPFPERIKSCRTPQ